MYLALVRSKQKTERFLVKAAVKHRRGHCRGGGLLLKRRIQFSPNFP